MKKTLLLLIGGTFLFVGYKNIPGTMSNGAPAASTGAPDEKHCSNVGCHATFAPNIGVAQLSISVGDNATEYRPGEKYQVTVSITNPDLVRFGFQAVALKNSDNTNAGTIQITDEPRTQIIPGYGNLSERKYATYTYAGTEAISTGIGKWSFEWIAPETNVGPVTFYVGSVAANNDGTDDGDYTYSKKITLSPSEISWNIFPNVSDSKFNFLCLGIPADIKIYNASGEKVFEKKNVAVGTNSLELNQPSGIYFVSATQNGKTSVQKILIAR